MPQGHVTRLVRDRGFGFIRPEDHGVDLFFHRSAVQRPDAFEQLQEGDSVTFEQGASDKGPRAELVRVL